MLAWHNYSRAERSIIHERRERRERRLRASRLRSLGKSDADRRLS